MANSFGTVATSCEEYNQYLAKWVLARDAVNLTVKDKGELYLPYPSTQPQPNLAKRNARYLPYINRAIFAGYTKRTVDTLVGSAFKTKPTLEKLPSQLNDLIENITGTGLSIDQLAKATERTTMITGRSGQYTSYPETREGASAAETAGLMPTVSIYNAEDIINWNDDNSLIVLCETYDKSDDEFVQDMGKQYRVLRMREASVDDDGNIIPNTGGATSQIYREDDESTDEVPLIDGFGVRWDKIPFEWVGSANNDNVIDDSLIYAIAVQNIGHYQNSAARRESSAICGQPTLFFTSSHQDQSFNEMNPNGIELGALRGHHLGLTGSAELLQPEPHGSIRQDMLDDENVMIQQGAKLITDSANETAEAVKMQAASETANLSSLTHNTSSATENSLKNCARYKGVDGSMIEYNVSQEFFDSSIDPQTILAMVQLYDRGLIGAEEVQNPLLKANLIARTAQEIADEVDIKGLGE